MELQERRPTAKGSAAWFTGDVYVDPIAQGDHLTHDEYPPNDSDASRS
jgi:hypothetical protein